jgi:hypothetical protein
MATIAAARARPSGTPFGWLAVGIVMSQVDLRVNGLDLLPDVVGYLLVALAAYRLRPLDRAFTVAAWCAALAAPFSVASLDRPTGSLASKTGHPALDVALALADAVILWCACTGVIAAAEAAGDGDLARDGRFRRALVVTVAVVWLLSPVLGPPVTRLPLGAVAGLLVAFAVVALAALVLVVGLLRRAGASLAGAAAGTS